MGGHAIIHGDKLQEILREEVQGALKKRDVEASELAEFYLVGLLSDYQSIEKISLRDGAEDIEKPLAIQLLEATDGCAAERVKRLRRLGDHALVVAGLFTESIRSTIVNLRYYVTLGGAAYGCLSHMVGEQEMFSGLYSELAAKFADFAEVLAIVAPWNRAGSDSDIVKIYERWLATGDDNLRSLLEAEGICAGDGPAITKIQ